MKSRVFIAIAAFAVASQVVSAHCTSPSIPHPPLSSHPPNNPPVTFVRIAHNSVWQAPTRYFRNKTVPYEERFSLPGHGFTTREFNYATVYPDYPESVRCGRDNVKHAQDTDVLDVVAGDTLEFAHVRNNPEDWKRGTWECKGGAGACYEGATGFVSISLCFLVNEGAKLSGSCECC
jgi:hypothetical protein